VAAEPPGLPFEETAEELFEQAPCGYLATDADGTIFRVNATFLRWTGLERDEVVGRVRFQDLLAGGGRLFYETHLAPMLWIQGSARELALELRCPGGRLPVLLNATVRKRPDGTPAVMRITVLDARERRAYEQELQRVARRSALLARLGRAFEEHLGVAERGRRLAAMLAAEVGDAALVEVVDGDRRRWTAGDEALLAGGHEAEVALPAVGRTSGRLVVARRAGPPEDPALLTELAERAALALENARLAEHERGVAETLQRSLLTTDLPERDDLALAPLYRPAVDELEVGGDWYDVFAVDGDRLLLVIGDVVGRGLRAATTMGQLRSALRALALAGTADPARLLDGLDLFAERHPPAQAATVAVALLDLPARRLCLACAGHLPPILVSGGEARLLWGGRSAPLGAYPGPFARPSCEHDLAPADRLLLFTDGLVERPGHLLDDDMTRLAAAFARGAPLPLAEAVAEATRELMAHTGGRDDICVLGAGLHAQSAPAGAAGAGRVPAMEDDR
jgi:PAS domain S-box-containing protein